MSRIENNIMEDDHTFTITGGPLKPHEYITVKREMSAADDAWIQNHATSVGGTKKKPEVQLTIGDIKLAALKRMIVRWQLTRSIKAPDGSEMTIAIELTDQAIEDLPRRISAYVNRKIDELNPEDEDDEDFLTDAGASSEENSKKTKTRRQNR
jgi:hypothetical protein